MESDISTGDWWVLVVVFISLIVWLISKIK